MTIAPTDVTLAALVFWGTLAAVVVLGATLLATLAIESVRVWPPPGRRTWQYRLTWTLFTVAFAGFLVVGGLDAGRLGLARWLGEAGTLVLGSTLFMGGTALASYAMGYIGYRAALGLEAELVTDGPFAGSPGWRSSTARPTDATKNGILAFSGGPQSECPPRKRPDRFPSFINPHTTVLSIRHG